MFARSLFCSSFRLGFLLLATFLAFGATAGAQEIVAIDQANPPMMYGGPDGKAHGVYAALLTEAFRRMDVPLTLQPLPWKRALLALDAGRIGVGGIYKTPDRAAKYDYSDRLYDEAVQVYVRRAELGRYQGGIDSLQGRKIGVILGWSYGSDLDGLFARNTAAIVPTESDAHNFVSLAGGQIDALIAVRQSGEELMKTNDYADRLAVLPLRLPANTSFLAFAKLAGKRDLLARFDKALATMRADGSFDRIIKEGLR